MSDRAGARSKHGLNPAAYQDCVEALNAMIVLYSQSRFSQHTARDAKEATTVKRQARRALALAEGRQ